MMINRSCRRLATLGNLVMIMLLASMLAAPAAADEFTFQARLTDAGAAANGAYDFRFRLYSTAGGPEQVGPELVMDGLNAIDGQVAVDLDFGSVFDGTDYWIEVDVKPATLEGGYTTLSPRQPIRPTPYAHYAWNAMSIPDGGLPANYGQAVNFSNAANQFSGDGSGLIGLNADAVLTGNLDAARMPSGGGWSLNSNLDVDSGTLFLDPTLNRIGIGTSAPAAELDVTGTVRMLGFEMPTGALPGHVLTSDSFGVGTWQPTFTIPITVVINEPQTGLSLTNLGGRAIVAATAANGADALLAEHTGIGRAGLFRNLNTSNSTAVLETTTNSTGDAFRSTTTGDGRAARFQAISPGSTSDVVTIFTDSDGTAFKSETQGDGAAGIFINGAASNPTTALRALTNGTGRAAHVSIVNAASASQALEATTDGTGSAGRFISGTGASTSTATISAENFRTTGSALEVRNIEGTNTDAALSVSAAAPRAAAARLQVGPRAGGIVFETPALYVETNQNEAGSNPAALFSLENGSDPSEVLIARTEGTGSAARFEVNNSAGIDPAVEVTSDATAAQIALFTTGPGIVSAEDAVEVTARMGATPTAALLVRRRGASSTSFSTTPGAAFQAITNSGGPAGMFLKPSGVDNFPAIYAQSQGSSPAAIFRQSTAGFSGNASTGATVIIHNAQTSGNALNVQNIASSSAPALFVSSNNSTGHAASFSTSAAGGSANTVSMSGNTSSNVLFVDHSGTTGRIAHFHRDEGPGGGVEIDVNTTGVGLDILQKDIGLALNVEKTPPTPTLGAWIRNNHPDGSALRVENNAAVPFGAGRALDVNGPSFFTGGSRFIGIVDILGSLDVTASVTIDGDLNVSGTKNFRIDHPLDPDNKYLYHSCVESDERRNVYDGTTTTDGRGYATVRLPDWFEAINRDFRYQLTVIDESDSESFILAKIVRGIANNAFSVRTSEPFVTVSWQVTGVRQDAHALENPFQVEVDKTAIDPAKK